MNPTFRRTWPDEPDYSSREDFFTNACVKDKPVTRKMVRDVHGSVQAIQGRGNVGNDPNMRSLTVTNPALQSASMAIEFGDTERPRIYHGKWGPATR